MKNKEFYILFDGFPFDKGDIIQTNNHTLQVTKLIKSTWWRKILTWFGFKFYIGMTKVKSL